MKLLLTLSFIFILSIAHGQEVVQWQFSAKEISEGNYEIHLAATVRSPWHTYSQTTPDGGPLATKIIFTKNPLIKVEGKPTEAGELKTVHDHTFDVDVKYFLGNVDFIQNIKVKGKVKTTLTGTVTFMACNDQQCLPPKTIPFTILLQ